MSSMGGGLTDKAFCDISLDRGALGGILNVVRKIVGEEEAPDLSLRQMGVLLLTAIGFNKATVKSLSDELNISRPAVSRALNRLEEEGFVRRLPHPTDGRVVVLTVLPSAYRYLATASGRQ